MGEQPESQAHPTDIRAFDQRSFVKVDQSLYRGLTLDKVHNGSVKGLVCAMKAANLSAQTITTYVNLVKNVVGSVVDEESGEPIYPRKWRSDILDLPIIENQKQPCFSTKEMEALIVDTFMSRGWEGDLFTLLAASGLRISEALALESKHLVNKGRTIIVEQQVSRFGKIVPYTKTKSGMRQVDLHPEIAEQFVISRSRNRLLFPPAKALPASSATSRSVSCIPIRPMHSMRSGDSGTHGCEAKTVNPICCFIGWDTLPGTP